MTLLREPAGAARYRAPEAAIFLPFPDLPIGTVLVQRKREGGWSVVSTIKLGQPSATPPSGELGTDAGVVRAKFRSEQTEYGGNDRYGGVFGLRRGRTTA